MKIAQNSFIKYADNIYLHYVEHRLQIDWHINLI